MLTVNVKATNELFTDEAGNTLPYVAYVLTLDDVEFKIVPKKKDKRLINYLLEKYDLLKDNVYLTTCFISQESFRDSIKRRTLDYVAYTVDIYCRKFRFILREEDRSLMKYLLEEKGFFIDDDDTETDED